MLTKEQRKLRKSHITASEIPALFGEHLKLTGTDIYLMKAFGQDDKEQHSAALSMGEDFELPLLHFAARELNVEITTDPDKLFRVHDIHPILSATLDALIVPQCKEAIEAKTTSMDNDDTAGKDNEWGAEDTDIIPTRVLFQCQAQIACHNLDRVHVVALLGRNGLKRQLYRVERNDIIIAAIIEKAEAFWRDYVLLKKQPPEEMFGLGSLDILKRVIRTPQTWAEVSDELIMDWETKRKAKLDAEKAEEEAKARVLTPLGDAEGARVADGRILTYYASSKRAIDQSKLKADYPDVYNAVLKDSAYRTLRIKEL